MSDEVHAPGPFVWGADIVRTEAGGRTCLTYAARRQWVPDLLVDAARFDDRAFMVAGARRLTFADHRQAVATVATRLAESGVRPGDRVMLLSANSPEMIAAWWAVLRVGATVVLANAWWSTAEVEAALAVVDPVLVIADAKRHPTVPDQIPVLATVDLKDCFGFVDAPVGEWRGQEDDPAVIMFTSGTTGAPKGAVLSHRAIIANLHNLLLASGRLPQDLRSDRSQDVSLLAVPLFHISGLQGMLVSALTGGRLVFRSGRFDSSQILNLIEAERVTTFGAVPTMLSRVLDDPDFHERDVSSVRTVTTGGMPVPASLVERLRSGFPNVRRGLGQVYGLTESGGVLTMNGGARYVTNPESSGQAMPVVELRIEQPDADGDGEVLARSPANMSGYFNLPDDDTVDADGWLHTGDLGRLVGGELFLVGRSKDVIIRGGENVAAPHIEACLLDHPDVAEVAVLGLADPDLGEEVAAVIVPHRGVTILPAELADFASARLAHFEVPTRWWVRPDELPTNASGKVVKPMLRAEWPEDLSRV